MENWNKISFTELISDRTKDGIKLPTNEYNQSGLTAIIDQGQEFIAGYSDETEGAFTDVPAIIFGDHTRVFKYVDFPFFLGADGVKVLKANQEINYKYLYYYFLQAKFPNTGYARHFKWLKELQIPLPPLEEQKHIAAVLDKCTALIAKHKLMLEKYDTLIKSRFIEMFGDPLDNQKNWEVQTLGNLCEIVRGGSPRPIDKFLGGSIPWIKIGDATNGDDIYLYKTKEHIIEEGIKKSRLIPEGSLIFANCGVSLGFARIIKFQGCIHDGWLAFQNISPRVNNVFLLKSLNMCTDYFRKTAPDGTQPNLNTTIMKSFVQILPPKDLQDEYVQFVQQIDKSKFAVQKSLEKAETLYKSLMQEYFG